MTTEIDDSVNADGVGLTFQGATADHGLDRASDGGGYILLDDGNC